jgi:hypothetical protein
MEFDRNIYYYTRNILVYIFTWKELENFKINWKNSVKSKEKKTEREFFKVLSWQKLEKSN